MNGSIDMRLGGKVHDGPGAVLGKELGNEFGIADIALHKGVTRIPLDRCEVLEVSGVGELIEIDDGVLLEGDPVEDKI